MSRSESGHHLSDADRTEDELRDGGLIMSVLFGVMEGTNTRGRSERENGWKSAVV